MVVALSTFACEGLATPPQSTSVRRRSGHVGLCEVAAVRTLAELNTRPPYPTNYKARRAVSAKFIRVDLRSDVVVVLYTFA